MSLLAKRTASSLYLSNLFHAFVLGLGALFPPYFPQEENYGREWIRVLAGGDAF